ncbi:MAG: hypothetical protein JWO38_1603 [Gemmataceae bacterium]|nr:hypothetical protein [Gemmataceae bacterium]
MLKGTQTRDNNIPAADGKPAVTAHPAVRGLEIPTRDGVVEVKIRFDGATMIDVGFDDRKYTGSHYGHICRARVRLAGVTLIDERDDGMRNDPAKKAEGANLLAARRATDPTKSKIELGAAGRDGTFDAIKVWNAEPAGRSSPGPGSAADSHGGG